MSSRNKKQSPGLCLKFNLLTQKSEQSANRALRRRNLARARKEPGTIRTEYKENLLHREHKASRLYTE